MIRLIYISILYISFLNADFIRDNLNEVVLDTTTDLVWEDKIEVQKSTWDFAIMYCNNLTIGEYKNWRLPNFNELFLLVDKEKHDPSIDSSFKSTLSDQYWTSTTASKYRTSSAIYIDFENGITQENSKSKSIYVRCVHSID